MKAGVSRDWRKQRQENYSRGSPKSRGWFSFHEKKFARYHAGVVNRMLCFSLYKKFRKTIVAVWMESLAECAENGKNIAKAK